MYAMIDLGYSIMLISTLSGLKDKALPQYGHLFSNSLMISSGGRSLSPLKRISPQPSHMIFCGNSRSRTHKTSISFKNHSSRKASCYAVTLNPGGCVQHFTKHHEPLSKSLNLKFMTL